MRVDVEEIQKLRARLAEINKIPLEEIEFYEKGKKLEILEDVIEEFKFTGLSNVNFIDVKFWE